MEARTQAARRHFPWALAVALFLVGMVSAPAALASPSFTTSNYNSPSVTTDSNGTLITVLAPPAGVYYTAQLDPTHTYQVTMTGQDPAAKFNLRLQRDAQTPLAYRAAPSGSPQTFEVDRVSRLQMLLYSSTGGAQYRLNSLQIVDCTGSCHGDGELKQQILSETPGLSSALASGDGWSAAKLLLHWAAPRIAWANSSKSLIDTSGFSASQLFYSYFQPRRGGVYCGGSADFLVRTLAIFGIPSFRMDFGTADQKLTHAEVGVPQPNSSGGTDYFVLDPTFNLDFSITTSGKPATAPQIWELWRAGYLSHVQVNSQPLDSRNVLLNPDGAGGFSSLPCSSMPGYNGCSLDGYLNTFKSLFVSEGLTTGFSGFVQLEGSQTLFYPRATGIPSDYVDLHDRFATAVANNDDSVHVSYLPLPPSSTNPPSISGDEAVGSQLTATTGQWSAPTPIDSYTYQWSDCGPDGSTCHPISGATSSTYTPDGTNLGHALKVAVTAHDTDGTSDPAVATTGPIGTRLIPLNTTRPTISGTPTDGNTLTAGGDQWDGAAPIDDSYQWEACASDGTNCQPIQGATDSQLSLSQDEAGSRIRVVVTGTNSYGSDSAKSDQTDVVAGIPPKNMIPPPIVGTPQDNQNLVVGGTWWTGTGPFSYAYQWYKCQGDGSNCQPIQGATNDRIWLTPSSYVGKQLMVEMTVTTPYGTASARSQTSGPVAGAPVTNYAIPIITGTTTDGQVLWSGPSGWNGTGPFNYSYQWMRCAGDGSCKTIANATGDRYRLQSADIGSTIELQMSVGNAYGPAAVATSQPTGQVAGAPPQNVRAPSLTGTAVDGQVLSSSGATWSGTLPFSGYSYQWMRCAADGSGCQNIGGATSDRYRLTSDDVAHRVQVVMTARNPYGSGAGTSNQTAAVGGVAPAPTAAPSIGGTAAVGQNLTVLSRGRWSGTTPMTLTMQWFRCTSAGSGCQAIPNATGFSYGLTGQDRGSTVKVTVTATNGTGAASSDSNLIGPVN